MRSLLVLFVGVGLLSMSLQMIVMERLHNESLGYYQNALIDSRFYETTSFAKLVRNDMDTFGTQIYMLYSGTEFKRLKTSLNEGAITGHYLQDCQYIWSELKMRMLDNSLLSDVSLYMMDSRRKVTTGSVVRFGDDESKWLEELTKAESGVALFDQTLYLWIPRFYGKYRRAEDMDCIAVGSITESNARKYLNQFSADISEANLMLIPGIILYIVFCYIPMGGIVIAFQRFIPAKGMFGPQQWVGLDNFSYILSMPNTLNVIRNTVVIALWKIVLGLVVPIAASQMNPELMKLTSDRALKCSQVIVSCIPILCVYPFLQRFFVTGLVVGSVKG